MGNLRIDSNRVQISIAPAYQNKLELQSAHSTASSINADMSCFTKIWNALGAFFSSLWRMLTCCYGTSNDQSTATTESAVSDIEDEETEDEEPAIAVPLSGMKESLKIFISSMQERLDSKCKEMLEKVDDLKARAPIDNIEIQSKLLDMEFKLKFLKARFESQRTILKGLLKTGTVALRKSFQEHKDPTPVSDEFKKVCNEACKELEDKIRKKEAAIKRLETEVLRVRRQTLSLK